MGTGIWSMHFIGMQAYGLPIELGYRELPTFLSWVAAVVVSGIALWIAGRGTLTMPRLVVGSAAMAAGICAMHYTGMAAMDMAPGIVWNGWLVAPLRLLRSWHPQPHRSSSSGCVAGTSGASCTRRWRPC